MAKYYISKIQKKLFDDILDRIEENGENSEASVEFFQRAVRNLEISLYDAKLLKENFEDQVNVVDTDAIGVVPAHLNDFSRVPICLPKDLYDATVQAFLEKSGCSTVEEFFFQDKQLDMDEEKEIEDELEPLFEQYYEERAMLERTVEQFPMGVQCTELTGKESLNELKDILSRAYNDGDLLSSESTLIVLATNTLHMVRSMDKRTKVAFYLVIAEIFFDLAKAHQEDATK